MIKKFLLRIIYVYQRYISPAYSRRCRYYPTCSAYAKEAIMVHGIFKGLLFAFFRFLRCNPLFKGGYDPVPTLKKHKNID
ncbi:MAG: membrane protein insertion efficiency factor YidD [Oscillospiraceae bacterium]|nr:membrane protein insertion efficiency factor YidD [Oscillospiraceae bacterium]